jgi:hypothetical protein
MLLKLDPALLKPEVNALRNLETEPNLVPAPKIKGKLTTNKLR